jgi:hypothetical protein
VTGNIDGRLGAVEPNFQLRAIGKLAQQGSSGVLLIGHSVINVGVKWPDEDRHKIICDSTAVPLDLFENTRQDV